MTNALLVAVGLLELLVRFVLVVALTVTLIGIALIVSEGELPTVLRVTCWEILRQRSGVTQP
jgi:hypothetical protein